MLESVAEFVKSSLIPGSFTFLLLGLTLGVLLGYGPRRCRRLAIPALTLLAGGYWLASLPIVSEALATRFHARDAAPATATRLAGAEAIVVLGAGASSYSVAGHTTTVPHRQTLYNAVEAARLFHLMSGRLTVIASGGVARPQSQEEPETTMLRDLLVSAGVPPERIILESESRTTHEQALNIAPLLKAHDWEHFALVTPPVQLPRAAAVFATQGVHPIPAAAPYRPAIPGRSPPSRWIPNGGSLNDSAEAAYDYLAWGYYWMRGWLTK
jgi:uncharacterized SAM-binding protein YcdF (DUF218 family)